MMTLGQRMKRNYEDRNQTTLTRRMPVIIRLDGVAFHTYTKNRVKPFDLNLNTAMLVTMKLLVDNIQGCKLGYTQSDEISLLLIDYDRLETEAWFDYNVQKMVSVSASMASNTFNLAERVNGSYATKSALFDSRVFNIPADEVNNYFVWRQKDCIRNSITSWANVYYSHKELEGKNSADRIRMLMEKGINWNSLSPTVTHGTSYTRNDGFTARNYMESPVYDLVGA